MSVIYSNLPWLPIIMTDTEIPLHCIRCHFLVCQNNLNLWAPTNVDYVRATCVVQPSGHSRVNPALPARPIPQSYRAEVRWQIAEMLEREIITESSSPYCSPAVFVKKKNGDLRICIDYRRLNAKAFKDSYPLPLPYEVQERLAGAAKFSKLDLNSGYWQVPLHCNDREMSAFSPGPGMGLFQFNVMPFGLTNAPGTFQRMMDSVLRGLEEFCFTSVDDN